MTPRRRALGVRLTLCNGECSSDAVLCAIHQAIEMAIQGEREDCARIAAGDGLFQALLATPADIAAAILSHE